MSDSFGDIRAMPRVTKLVVGAISVVTSLSASAIAAAMWLDGLATDVELGAAVAPLAKRDDIDREFGTQRHENEIERRAQRKRDIAVFEHLVSMQAADLEHDSRRKAAAASFARTAYREALARGVEPEDAARQALDQQPRWRR